MTFKLMLDAGHGGSDAGAVGNGLREKDLTLAIAKRIGAMLNDYEGVQVFYTRTGDTYPTLKQRADMANKYGVDFFVSVHINAGGGAGFETYVYNGGVSEATKKAQATIHDAIYAEMKKLYPTCKDRGKKQANYAVLRETRMPALLTENLFIDNEADAAKLKDGAFIEAVARGHVLGIAKAFGLKRKEAPKPAEKPAAKPATPSNNTKGKTLYRVVSGSFSDRENAEKRVQELKKAGFDAFIFIDED